jgi:20S proteasome alpha/beta subunit
VTLVLGLQGKECVVLASDSQATHGELRQSQAKLFKTKHGIVWGSAGPFASTQDLYPALEAAELSRNPDREAAKTAIRAAMRTATANLDPTGDAARFEGLFGWYAAEEKRHYLLWARQDGHVEFERPFGAIGSGSPLGRFGFVRAEFLEYEALPLDVTELVTHMVAEDAVRASAKGVDLPIQLAFACQGEAQVVQAQEVKGISDAVDAFRESQRDFLIESRSSVDETGRFEIRLDRD